MEGNGNKNLDRRDKIFSFGRNKDLNLKKTESLKIFIEWTKYSFGRHKEHNLKKIEKSQNLDTRDKIFFRKR